MGRGRLTTIRRSAALALLAALAAALAPACGRRPSRPEERVRALLEQAARAAEARKPDQVVELLSPSFRAESEDGVATRDEVRRLVAFELLRGGWLSVTVAGARVAVEGRRARANLDVVTSRAPREKGLAALLPGEAAAHRFWLELAEERGEWRVVSGRWRRIELAEALSGPEPPEW